MHDHRASFQHMYQGKIVANSLALELNSPAAKWLIGRAVYVQNMRVGQSMVDELLNGAHSLMREATKVIVEQKTALNSATASAIFGNCRQLTSLCLLSCTFDADALHTVMSLCPLLWNVSLPDTNADKDIVSALLSPRIVSLDLSGCPSVDDSTVVAVTNACTNLQSLNLDYCRSCTGVSLEAIGRSCPQLQELSVQEGEDRSA